jgi:hypothetical protein
MNIENEYQKWLDSSDAVMCLRGENVDEATMAFAEHYAKKVEQKHRYEIDRMKYEIDLIGKVRDQLKSDIYFISKNYSSQLKALELLFNATSSRELTHREKSILGDAARIAIRDMITRNENIYERYNLKDYIPF